MADGELMSGFAVDSRGAFLSDIMDVLDEEADLRYTSEKCLTTHHRKDHSPRTPRVT